MTLSTKKSRAIIIDDKEYRYQISTTRIDKSWNFSLNLTVQQWNSPSKVLQVSGLVTRDYWLDISDGAQWNKDDYPVILPRHIIQLVKLAISQGWIDSEKNTFRLNTNNGSVFKAI